MAKLKVYRTAAGFHDAYVAAPSQKAAMEAWGTDKNLFARGAAELVTDPALMAEPLAAPGTVIKRTRGSLKEQLAALGARPVRRKSSSPAEPAKPNEKPKPRTKPKPKPSRAVVERAEEALRRCEAARRERLADIDRRENELAEQRRNLEAKFQDELDRLNAALAQARERYREQLDAWEG